MNGNLYPAMLGNNNPPRYAAQPKVIVANPMPVHVTQYPQAAPPQQYVQHVPPQPYPVQQQVYVAPVMNEAPPAYQPYPAAANNVVIVPAQNQMEGAYTHR